MQIALSDIIPISQARARLTELADDVARNGGAKLLTRNGEGYAAIVSAQDVEDLQWYRDTQRLADLSAIVQALPEIRARTGMSLADFEAYSQKRVDKLLKKSAAPEPVVPQSTVAKSAMARKAKRA